MAKQAQIDAVRPVLTALDHEVTAAEHVIDAVVSNADKATDVVESSLEKVADVVPEVLDKTVHATANVTRRGVLAFRNPRTAAIVIATTCVVAGASLGVLAYHLQKRRLEKQFDERLETQLEEMRVYYLRRNKDGQFATPRSAAEALLAEEAVEALKEYRAEESENAEPEKKEKAPAILAEPETAAKNQAVRYDKVITDSEAAEAIRENVVSITETTGTSSRNVFVNGTPLVDDDWDAEAEEAQRDPNKPYVISHEEFMENTFDHPQHSLTYYRGDDVLVDERDEMISDVESLIGTENLAHFGHGSLDANIVYIRNERPTVEADFEVALSQGKFSEEVMGLRHSDDTFRLRKARWGDNE